jgi:class 3 adenylate cyclase
MPDYAAKSLREPDETIRLPSVELDVVDVGDLTVGRAVHQPGWRWSTHARPTVGGEWCQVRHVGVVLSGRLGIQLETGTSYELETDDVYDVPPGHDGYVIGHEPVVMIEWAGIRAFAGFTGGLQNRMLVTLLAAQFVDSGARARELGNAAWRELLSVHFEAVRAKLEPFGGREITLAGDGMLVTFSSPALALRCATEIKKLARSAGLGMRFGVHVGEVELVGSDIRGAAVHETEGILGAADDGEILVSDTTRALALASDMRFEERGTQSLHGLRGDWRLHAYVVNGSA